MTIKVLKGNIFTSQCQTLVNPVNCQGVMGAGIALEYKLRFPEMYARYVELCERKLLDIGLLWLYRQSSCWVLNFPTKRNWKHPSNYNYLKQGLQKFVDTYQAKGITSIAFPLLGADKGGLDVLKVEQLMCDMLMPISQVVDIEIYHYDSKAQDDLFDHLCTLFNRHSIVELAALTGVTQSRLNTLDATIASGRIYQVNQLAKTPGIGIKTLEKVFTALMQGADNYASMPLAQASMDL